MQNNLNGEKFWIVIPAAGVGKRMQVNHPKQYLTINGKTILEHTLACFSHNSMFAGIVIAISEDDAYWPDLNIPSEVTIYQAKGGKERCFSVLNGLHALASLAHENDWVLVHDAARPCLRQSDLTALIQQIGSHSVGGLLGLPVADTLKYCGDNLRVKRTVSRNGLWRALTPQMFRYKKLRDALEVATRFPERVTDEASAMEMCGYEPVMVEGHWDNIKITHPQDLTQAKLILQSREN